MQQKDVEPAHDSISRHTGQPNLCRRMKQLSRKGRQGPTILREERHSARWQVRGIDECRVGGRRRRDAAKDAVKDAAAAARTETDEVHHGGKYSTAPSVWTGRSIVGDQAGQGLDLKWVSLVGWRGV